MWWSFLHTWNYVDVIYAMPALLKDTRCAALWYLGLTLHEDIWSWTLDHQMTYCQIRPNTILADRSFQTSTTLLQNKELPTNSSRVNNILLRWTTSYNLVFFIYLKINISWSLHTVLKTYNHIKKVFPLSSSCLWRHNINDQSLSFSQTLSAGNEA